jgi:uncharacterized membrane protein YciS (DUF1049 family)
LRTVALFLGVVFLLALGGALSYFLVVNAQWVLVRFPGVRLRLEEPFALVQLETPLAAVMAVAFVLGFLAALLVMVLPGWLRRGVERRRERRFIRGLEGELTDLRNLPVTSPAPLEDLPEEPRSPRPAAQTAEEEERALLAAALGAAGEEEGALKPRPGGAR